LKKDYDLLEQRHVMRWDQKPKAGGEVK